MDSQNGELQRLIGHFGVAERVILAGPTSDVTAVMNAIDVHVLSSRAESLPVAVLEAMACGTPCVVTDVGDARHMVGQTGWVARPQDPSDLAQAIETAMGEPGDQRAQRGVLCRKRVIDEFSLAKMAAAYAALWKRAATCVE
jgi:glycosyltransferase involved in cell wall biosynthesis